MVLDTDLEGLFRNTAEHYHVELEESKSERNPPAMDFSVFSMYGEVYINEDTIRLSYQREGGDDLSHEDSDEDRNSASETVSFNRNGKLTISSTTTAEGENLGFALQVHVPAKGYADIVEKMPYNGVSGELMEKFAARAEEAETLAETQGSDEHFIVEDTKISGLEGVQELVYSLLD